MKMKKTVSAIAALAMASSVFAGFATVASAADTTTTSLTSNFAGVSTGSDITDMTQSTENLTVVGTQFRDWASGSDGSVKFTNGSLAIYQFDISNIEGKVTEAKLTLNTTGTNDGKNSYNIRLLGYNGATTTLSNTGDRETLTGTVAGAGSFQPLDTRDGLSTGTSFPSTLEAVATTYVDSAVSAEKDTVSFAMTANITRAIYLTSTATLSITTSTAQYIDYTINYQLDGDTTVKTVTGSELDGSIVSAEAYVYAEDGTKYYTVADPLPSMTLSEDVKVLNVPVRVANSYDVDVDVKLGENAAQDYITEADVAVEGESYSYYYPAYMKDAEGNYYKCDETTYGVVTDNVSADISGVVKYSLVEDTNVVAFIEGEDSVKTGGSENLVSGDVKLSNGGAKNIQRQTTESLKFTFTVPVEGTYKLTAPLYNSDAKNRSYNVYIDDEAYTTDVVASGTLTGKAYDSFSVDVNLKAGEHTVYYAVSYMLTPAIDYLLVTTDEELTPSKTAAEVTVDEVGTYTEDEGKQAKAYTGTFTVGENNFAVSGITWTVGTASDTLTFDTTISSGTVVTGLVVLADDASAIPTPTAVTVAAE